MTLQLSFATDQLLGDIADLCEAALADIMYVERAARAEFTGAFVAAKEPE